MSFRAYVIASLFAFPQSLVASEPEATTPSSVLWPIRADGRLQPECTGQICKRQIGVLGPIDWERMGDAFEPQKSNSALEAELESEFVLWNSSCTGNKSAIAESFFNTPNGTMYYLMNNRTGCFLNESQSDCTPALESDLAEVKSWMRSPDCQSQGKMIISVVGWSSRCS